LHNGQRIGEKDMDKFDEIKKHFDRNDKIIAKMDKLVRNMEKRMKKREIEHSQLAHAFQQANSIVKHLVLQNYLLQKRTGGVFKNDELEEGQKALQSQYDKRKKIVKPGIIQPKVSRNP
jgi:hypothetical protein